METMKHQGKKGNLTSDAIGKKYGDNTRKVYRYIRLSYLQEDLLNLIDNGKMTIQAGYWLSFLNEQEQGWILKIFQQYRKLPSGRPCSDAGQSRDSDFGEWLSEESEPEIKADRPDLSSGI